MLRLLRTLAFTAAAAAVLSNTTAALAVEIAPVSVKKIFTPHGFDDNDQVVFVIDGYMPNSCYRIGSVEHTVDNEAKTITVKQFARIHEGPCLMMLIPYTTEINVGTLEHGQWRVISNDGNLIETLTVEQAPSATPDSFLYAPIDRVWIERSDSGERTIVMEGRYTNNCMQIDDVRVTYSGSTIEVMPIMATEEREDCTDNDVEFRFSQPLSDLLPGRYLLHVRSMNGRAINTVFPVYEQGRPIE